MGEGPVCPPHQLQRREEEAADRYYKEKWEKRKEVFSSFAGKNEKTNKGDISIPIGEHGKKTGEQRSATGTGRGGKRRWSSVSFFGRRE